MSTAPAAPVPISRRARRERRQRGRLEKTLGAVAASLQLIARREDPRRPGPSQRAAIAELLDTAERALSRSRDSGWRRALQADGRGDWIVLRSALTLACIGLERAVSAYEARDRAARAGRPLRSRVRHRAAALPPPPAPLPLPIAAPATPTVREPAPTLRPPRLLPPDPPAAADPPPPLRPGRLGLAGEPIDIALRATGRG
ncbi:MAG: hypothetical protein IPK28_04450 [Devosia sp.]|nr:hypothetical protein [Devosia sp.]